MSEFTSHCFSFSTSKDSSKHATLKRPYSSVQNKKKNKTKNKIFRQRRTKCINIFPQCVRSLFSDLTRILAVTNINVFCADPTLYWFIHYHQWPFSTIQHKRLFQNYKNIQNLRFVIDWAFPWPAGARQNATKKVQRCPRPPCWVASLYMKDLRQVL